MRRRGQIVKKGDKRWLVRIFTGRELVIDDEGNESSARTYFNKTITGNKSDAEKYLTERLRALDTGTIVLDPDTTLSELFTKWLGDIVKISVREATHAHYTLIYENYIKPRLGTRKVCDLKALHIQGHYKHLAEQGLSARTIRYTHSLLNAGFKQGIKWRMLEHNPCEAVKLPKKTKAEMKYFTVPQVKDFLSSAKETKHYAALLLAIETGLRPAEYLSLRWQDVDLEQGFLMVRRSVKFRSGGGYYFTDPKSAKAERTVPITTKLVAALKSHRLDQREVMMKRRDIWKDNDLVFADGFGNPIRLENFRRRVFAKVIDDHNAKEGVTEKLPSIRLYDLRHTCATTLLLGGIHPKVVSERLGHESIEITLNTYSHVLPTMQEDATKRMEKLMFG